MNIETILLIEPRLVGLIDRARAAGRSGSDWWATLMQLHEPLSHIAGRGAEVEALQNSQTYETCRAAIHRAWCGVPVVDATGDDVGTCPWEPGWGHSGRRQPRRPARQRRYTVRI